MNLPAGAVPVHLRMLRIARRIYDGHDVTAKWIVAEFGVTWSTAKRDMQRVAMYLPVEILTRWPGRNPREKRLRIAPTP